MTYRLVRIANVDTFWEPRFALQTWRAFDGGAVMDYVKDGPEILTFTREKQALHWAQEHGATLVEWGA